MMRGLLGRLRTSRASVLYHRLDGTSEEDGRPWMTSFGDERGERAPGERTEIVNAERTETVGETVAAVEPLSGTRSDIETAPIATAPIATAPIGTAPIAAAPGEADPGLVPALNRVADAFERMAQSMEVEHREREARLGAVEELLRELVTGLAQPTAVPPVVLGGSIDLESLGGGAQDRPELEPDGGPEIDLVDPPDDAVKKPAAARRTKRG
jgi:hypothetical protein